MNASDHVIFRSTAPVSDVHVRFMQDKIDTMEKVFRFAVLKHGQKYAVGTREILAEEDELQPNGKIFKKVSCQHQNIFHIYLLTKYFLPSQSILGKYQWKTFTQMNDEAESFGRGLRELGLKAKENIVIFAETRAEWLIAANGAMKQNIPLVTLYANLGDEALASGINETEVSCVVTSQELLPKFKYILPYTPSVSVLVNLFLDFVS